MRVIQIIGGQKPARDSRYNIFVHRQVDSLRALIPDMEIIYAGLGSNLIDMINLAGKLRHAIKAFRPDVVHAQYATMTGAVTIGNCGSVPTVVSFGGDEIYGTYVNAHSTRSLRTSLARCCSRYCAERATVCVGKNETMHAILKDWGAKRVEVIPNGVNLNLFKELDLQSCRKQLGLKREVKYIIFSTRGHDDVKRRDLAEKAVELCRRNFSCQVELLILDKVAPNLMPLYLNAGNVLLLCSNHEGSPNIVKEALACNRPVVSTDVGDVCERFSAVRGLFLVQQHPAVIAEALLLAMRLERSNGRDFVTNLSEEIVAKQLLFLYQSIQANEKTEISPALELQI